MSGGIQEKTDLFRDAIHIAKGSFSRSVKGVVEKAIAQQSRRGFQLDSVEPIWLLAYLDDSSGRQLLESYLKSPQPQERVAAAIGIILSHLWPLCYPTATRM